MFATQKSVFSGKRKPWIKVCFVGTSWTDGTFITIDEGGTRRGCLASKHPAWVPVYLGQRVTFAINPIDNTYDFGFSGATFSYLINGSTGDWAAPNTPVARAFATNSDVYVLEGGMNDRTSNYATVMAEITAYWNYFRSRGKPVVALNMPPFASVTGTPTEAEIAGRDLVAAVNVSLPALALSLGVTLIDLHSMVVKDANGFCVTGDWMSGPYSNPVDYIHPTDIFAQRMGKAIAAAIRPHTLSNPVIYTIPDFADDTQWKTRDRRPSGSSKPTSWTDSTTGATFTAITDPDGTQWQRVEKSATNVAVALYNLVASEWVAGRQYQMTAKIRFAPGSDITHFNLGNQFVKGATTFASNMLYTGASATGGGTNGTGFVTGDEIMLISEPLTMATGTIANLTWGLSAYAHTKVAFDIRDIGVWEVGAGSGAVPYSLNPWLWLQADATSLYDDVDVGEGNLVAADAAVARWMDKSGHGHHFIQATGGAQPTRKTGLENGLDGVLFDVGKFMTCTSFGASDQTSMFILYKDNSTAGYVAPISGPSGESYLGHPNNTKMFLSPGTSTSTLTGNNAINGTSITNGQSTARPANLSILRCVSNGALAAITHLGTHAPAATTRNVVGPIMEVLIFPYILTTAQIALVENYLAARAAITLP